MSRPPQTGGVEELMVLRPHSVTDSDNELDWSYTVRCTKEWSDDELLSHLCSKAFTIPPRDYTPSAPFVYVRTEDGVVTTLPHGYRIPLMFVAKYQWETIFRTLSLQNRQHWEAGRDEVFHLSRLCHALFSKARAKAESSGMEKGWRCVMFDRLLTRFYKGWPVSSPAKLEAFISHFSSKEYERDILKNDWKRWALKGFFRPPSSSPSIHLSEEDVNNGITAVDLIMRLSKIDNVWTLSTNTKTNKLKRRPIKFMQPTEGSSSDLTDFDLSLDEDEDDENTNLDPHPPSTKRCREPSEGDDTKNRLGKRAKLEEIIRSISSPPCSPITLTCSGDGLDEEHVSLPKFKVPRQILHSYGWRPLSATDGLVRRRQREEQQEEVVEAGAGTDLLPTCNPDDPSTSILPSSGDNDTSHQPLLRSILQPSGSPTSPNLPSISSKSKGKQPEPASTNSTTAATSTTTTTGNTSRPPRNSVHVSLPSSSRMMKTRKKSPVPAAATPPPPSPKHLSPPMTRGRGDEAGNPTVPLIRKRLALKDPYKYKKWRKNYWDIPSITGAGYLHDFGGAGADDDDDDDDDDDMNGKKEKARTKQNAKDIEEKEIDRSQHSVQSSSSSTSMITPSTNMEDNEQRAISTTATPAPPELEPEPIHSTSYSISSSSSSLSSLSSSATPPPSGPPVSNNGGVGVVDADANVAYGTQKVKDRIRELKTRFLGFKDDLEKIIGRLEVLEGGEDGDLGQGGADGSSSDHPNLVSQASSQTEDRRKDKESDLDIEMIGVSESGGAIPGHTDAMVGVDEDALVALRDVSVQVVGASSATSLHSTDDRANVTKKSTLSHESKTDDHIPPPTQFVNTISNLSTMVDNLVSIKMLSMMQTLVKSSVGGNGNGKSKQVEPSTTTNIRKTTTTTTESDSDLVCQPSPSSSSLSNSAASHSMEAYDSVISSLLEELKTIKEEARCREQSEKEDLLAMRQLHSVEVDALRRRLSYLESRSLSLGRWDLNNGGGRWNGYDSLELDRHHRHHHRFFEDNGTSHSFRQQQYGDRSQAFQQNSLTHYSSRSASIVNPECASSSTNNATTSLPSLSVTSSTATADSSSLSLPTPTPPTPSDKDYSFGFSKDDNNHYHRMGMGMSMGMDLDDDNMANLPLSLPLPIKSQRKQHIMSLARTHFS